MKPSTEPPNPQSNPLQVLVHPHKGCQHGCEYCWHWPRVQAQGDRSSPDEWPRSEKPTGWSAKAATGWHEILALRPRKDRGGTLSRSLYVDCG
jgi:hypothetical protein